jgi:hypothetical protein
MPPKRKNPDIGDVVARNVTAHDYMFCQLMALVTNIPQNSGITRDLIVNALNDVLSHVETPNDGKADGVQQNESPEKKRTKVEKLLCIFDAYLTVLGSDEVYIINPSLVMENKEFASTAAREFTMSEFGKQVAALDGMKAFKDTKTATAAYQLFDLLRGAANSLKLLNYTGPAFTKFEDTPKASQVLRIIQSEGVHYKVVNSMKALKKLIVPLFKEFEHIEGDSLAFEYKKGTDTCEVLVVIAFTREPPRLLCVSHFIYLFA